MKTWQGILGWVVAAVFAVLYFQKCGHKCPVCPEVKQISGDTTYVPKQQPVKPDTASYIPEQKPVRTKNVQKSQKLGDQAIDTNLILWDNDYGPVKQTPVYEPLQPPAAPASDYFYPSPALFDTALRSIMDIIPCPIQTSTDTQQIADKGYVVINDLIRGSIIKRTFSYNISAATPAQEPAGNKPRARWYGGIEAIGPRNIYLGIAAGYQGPKSRTLFMTGAGRQFGAYQYRIGIFTQLNRNR
jgi:hypothetical protein